MGSKNRDRWMSEDWRAAAPDVRRMMEQGWRVMSACPTCHLNMWVDLKLVARVSGASTVLWNRRAPCRRIGCEGQVRFVGMPPGVGPQRINLDAEWVGPPPRYPPGQR